MERLVNTSVHVTHCLREVDGTDLLVAVAAPSFVLRSRSTTSGREVWLRRGSGVPVSAERRCPELTGNVL